jgi:hypothetical protein
MPSTRIAVLTATSVVTLLLTAACASSSSSSNSGAAPGGAKGSGSATSAPATDDAGSSGGSGSGSQVDPCTTLTTAQIQQVIGVPVGPGKKSDQPIVGCGWMDPNLGNNSGVVVMYVDPTIYDGTKNSNGQNGVTITSVSGLGDEAFIESFSPSTKPLLMIKKGTQIVSVSADIRANGSGDTDSAKDVAAEKQLAAFVVSAL